MNNPLLSEQIFGVSDFVAHLNQVFSYAYPMVTIRGELANFKISKNKWVYFDLKDDQATVRFFGTIYQLSGPLENGMLLRVRGTPKLHQQYGFSVTIFSISPEGEGSIRRAADLLRAKLEQEGLFDPARKRLLPYPPEKIGLITSVESAAYADFIKIVYSRWPALEIECLDVQVQGELAAGQIIAAIEHFNQQSIPPDVVVVIRGGGSPEDLYAFSTEQVARMVGMSRVPTLVAIGHEIDVSLAELAADRRASTPSNAAEILVPHTEEILRYLEQSLSHLREAVHINIRHNKRFLLECGEELQKAALLNFRSSYRRLDTYAQLLDALNPVAVMRRGYAIVRFNKSDGGRSVLRSKLEVQTGSIINIEVSDGSFDASVT